MAFYQTTALLNLNRVTNHSTNSGNNRSAGSGIDHGSGNLHAKQQQPSPHPQPHPPQPNSGGRNPRQAPQSPAPAPAPTLESARLPRRPSLRSRQPPPGSGSSTSASTSTSTLGASSASTLSSGGSMQTSTQLSPPRRPSLSSQRRPSAAMASSAAQAARRPSRSPHPHPPPHPPPSRSASVSTATATVTTYDPDRVSDPMSYRSVSASARTASTSVASGGQQQHPHPHPSHPQHPHMSATKTNSSGSLQPPATQMSNTCPPRRLRSQYPRGATENHVEYILVASFDIDKGPIMEHQFPVAITGDENMLAELMLPDQAHARNQDWTIFFLHKDTSQEEEDEARRAKEERRRRRRIRRDRAAGLPVDEDLGGRRGGARQNSTDLSPGEEDEDEEDDGDGDGDDGESTDSEPEGGEGPPLVYVLNLVNTKHDKTVKRGAIVKAMAICTRHPFLHIYKPLLLLALEEYFKSPVPETLSMLYNAVNAMDLSLMPRLSLLERHLLLASDNKDLFAEKFAQMIQMRMAEDGVGGGEGRQNNNNQICRPDTAATEPAGRRPGIPRAGTKAHFEGQSAYSIPRDTHEFETKVLYKGIPIPIKVPVAVMPETVGDFSLIKLIQNFSEPHAKSLQPYQQLHAHLTTNGPHTHPIIVLVNALLTQKRIIFLGHNMPSGEVAEAVLAACALASGGILRGFTRHAFPYTDLTKIDDLLNVPGFIAGVTNPTFEMHPEWWDVLCDLPSGRVRISNRIEPAPVTEGLLYFQQQNPGYAHLIPGPPMGAAVPSGSGGGGGGSGSSSSSVGGSNNDLTGDQAFLQEVLRSIAARHGERVIRAKWRDWVTKFTRIAAAFEESVYGASALYRGGAELESNTAGVCGHGYVWSDEAAKQKELAGNVTRIEGWRNTRSYYSVIQDLAQLYTVRPLKGLDLHHMHDRLRTQRLSPAQSREIYMAFARHVHSYDEVCLMLTVAPESHAGLFYIALGLFHKDRETRFRTAELLERIAGHEAGMHWFTALSRFEKLAFVRIRRETEAVARTRLEEERLGGGGGGEALALASRQSEDRRRS